MDNDEVVLVNPTDGSSLNGRAPLFRFGSCICNKAELTIVLNGGGRLD